MAKKGLRRKPRPKDLRARILTNLGLDPVRPQIVKSRRRARRPQDEKERLTWAMIAVEERFGETIRTVLNYGSLAQIEARYGIDATTAWRWRERLGMNEGKHRSDILPSEAI